MDIRNWSMNRIMQLPDCCFGRRWPVGLSFGIRNADPVFDICEAALPEVCILWEVSLFVRGLLQTSAGFLLALGDQLPTTEAEFFACETVFSGIEAPEAHRGEIEFDSHSGPHIFHIRQPVATAGRRFVGRAIRVLGETAGVQAFIVISSIPTEVPDWLISGQGRSQ
ncbi:hypothetical protein ES703_92467 [subsurface metagenome]